MHGRYLDVSMTSGHEWAVEPWLRYVQAGAHVSFSRFCADCVESILGRRLSAFLRLHLVLNGPDVQLEADVWAARGPLCRFGAAVAGLGRKGAERGIALFASLAKPLIVAYMEFIGRVLRSGGLLQLGNDLRQAGVPMTSVRDRRLPWACPGGSKRSGLPHSWRRYVTRGPANEPMATLLEASEADAGDGGGAGEGTHKHLYAEGAGASLNAKVVHGGRAHAGRARGGVGREGVGGAGRAADVTEYGAMEHEVAVAPGSPGPGAILP